MFEFLCALVFIYSCAIYRSEDEEEFQEDPEDLDFVEGQEEDLAKGKSYLSLIILNPWFTNTAYRACFKYLYCMVTLKYCLVNSYSCYYHAFDIFLLLSFCEMYVSTTDPGIDTITHLG